MAVQLLASDTLVQRLSNRLQGMSDDEKSALWSLAHDQQGHFAIVEGSSVDRLLADYARWSPGLSQSSQRAMQGLCSWSFDRAARHRFRAALEACLVGEAKQRLSKTWGGLRW